MAVRLLLMDIWSGDKSDGPVTAVKADLDRANNFPLPLQVSELSTITTSGHRASVLSIKMCN